MRRLRWLFDVIFVIPRDFDEVEDEENSIENNIKAIVPVAIDNRFSEEKEMLLIFL